MPVSRILTSAWLLLTVQSLAVACGGDKPDASSRDGATVGDQERDHDIGWASPFRRARAQERPTEKVNGAKNPSLDAPKRRDVGYVGGTGGADEGTTGEHGGPSRGPGL